MQDGKLTYEELERDLGRYKKKVQDDYKQILKLEADLEAWNEVKQLNQALVAAMLMLFNIEDEEHALVVSKDLVNTMLQQYEVRAKPNEEGTAMWVQKKAGEV